MKKIRLTETELIEIIEDIVNEEEEGTEGAGVETGTSDAGGTGAATWSTGLTRGLANPAEEIKRWEDQYGQTSYKDTVRGKGNPLWEEENDLLNESKWYNTFLDFVGIIDPTGVADGINAISYYRQGDYLFSMLSLISLVPYVGDAVAKPFIGLMKAGKIEKAAVNAGLKSGNATKVAEAMGKTKAGKAVLDAVANPKSSGFISNILGKLSSLPGFGKFSKDIKTYGKIFGEAAEIAAKTGKVRVFRKSGGLLTRMQRKGLLNRTKLWVKFISYLTGMGVSEKAISSMDENKLNSKFVNFLKTGEALDFFNTLNKKDQNDFVESLS